MAKLCTNHQINFTMTCPVCEAELSFIGQQSRYLENFREGFKDGKNTNTNKAPNHDSEAGAAYNRGFSMGEGYA